FEVGRGCPSCGAPMSEGEMLKCRYCGALVCSGEHDWVLAEITQLSEWRGSVRRASGLDALRSRDPGTAQETLEDRASYLFWKWVQAGRVGGFAPLRKCATPAFVASGGDLSATRSAVDVAIGAAELVACELGGMGARAAVDLVLVEVFWSARFGGSSSFTPVQSVIRMVRQSGVVSKVSMTALACTACGAPMVESDSTRCDHCGAELADGAQAWVLDAVLKP
ncbi:MAG: hypothetical protein ACREJ3_06310, partial [Polyangiaceae bacterium]